MTDRSRRRGQAQGRRGARDRAGRRDAARRLRRHPDLERCQRGPARANGGDSTYADLPLGPPRNASKSEIFSDFLQAATSSDGDYAIAREFLTKSAAKNWDPTKSVLIREKPATAQDLGDNSVAYPVSTRASINSLGVYSEQDTDSTQTLSYSFSKVDGQWRISTLPDGIVLSRNSFDNFFGSYPVYFFDPDYRFLVPDVRWFPTGATIQDRIVSALLAGPADWLQHGVVSSAVPPGLKLASPVTVHDSTATVDFTADIATSLRARLRQQLQQSLQTANITDVTMTANGAPITVSDPQSSTAQPAVAVDNSPLLQRGKQFGFYPRLESLGTVSAQVVALNGTAATLDRSQATAAVLASAGVYLVTGSGQPRLVDSRPNLIAPSIDPFGYVWSAPSTDASAIQATGADGIVHSIVSTVPGQSNIVSLDVSHDGTRLLLYVSTGAGPRLIVAGIVRQAGVPTSLGTLLDLPVSSAQPIDATWVDPSTVAALGLDGDQDSIISYVIGGPPGEPTTTVGGVHIVGGGDANSLRLITTDGQVEQLRASGWQDIGVSASILATQQ
ncbi:MAG: LpqB family beta-propeller domain-containing protein [Galbitalea sp.]